MTILAATGMAGEYRPKAAAEEPLYDVVNAMSDWAENHIDEVEAARQRYGAAEAVCE